MQNGLLVIKTIDPDKGKADLERELGQALQALRQTEAELANEQAAVNRFRMQHRLKIGDLVEEILTLQTEYQTLLTELRLRRQEQTEAEEIADPFSHGREAEFASAPPLTEDAAFQENVAPYLEQAKATATDREAEKRLYRELARRYHPDRAASGSERAFMTVMMTTVNVAYEKRDMDTLRDLADETDPELKKQLADIEMPDLRTLHRRILRIHRRHRRAAKRLTQHRQEHTTRLWIKAAELEAEGQAWWTAVRTDLQTAVYTFQEKIAQIRAQLTQLTPAQENS